MLTGVVLLGFAVGWALLAVLSVRVSDRPQRWAAAPAVFLTVAGLVALLGSDTVIGRGFRWVWPPLLLVLAVWSITRARRQMPRRARRWLVYPLLAGLALSAIGGGYETVRESIDPAAYRPRCPELHQRIPGRSNGDPPGGNSCRLCQQAADRHYCWPRT